MRRAGVRFMCGTDLGNEYIYPGFSVHDELRLLVDAGSPRWRRCRPLH
jgi:hypothetical protein